MYLRDAAVVVVVACRRRRGSVIGHRRRLCDIDSASAGVRRMRRDQNRLEQIQQRKQEDPHQIDKVPVQADVLDEAGRRRRRASWAA